MADKQAAVAFITPRATFVYPKLTQPDTKFDAAGVYSVKVRLAPDALPEPLVEKLTALRDEFADAKKKELAGSGKGAKAKSLKVREVLTPETDKDSGDETGFVLVNAKMKASGTSKKTGKAWKMQPKLFDSKGKALPKGVNIWGGSEGKVAIEAVPYYAPNDNVVGLTFRLQAAQVLKLVSGSGEDASAFGFGEEEGYEAEEADADAKQFDDSAAGDSDAESGDEF